ncbi:MAG: hypothetical protein JNN15_00280 [Blastocatellia bacterium]|nr:hypothetical protein [Blastocatellia bacterium]
MNSPIFHYYKVLLPLVSALDTKSSNEVKDAVKEIDYLIETLSHSELTPSEQEETELAYWAWWEKVRRGLQC